MSIWTSAVERTIDTGWPSKIANLKTGLEQASAAVISQLHKVRLRESLSNSSPALIALDEAIRKKKPQVKRDAPLSSLEDHDGGERRSLIQLNRKLQPAEIDDLVVRYLAGARIAALGRHFGMHEQTVRAHLQRRNVELRGKQALSAVQIRQVISRYSDGQSSLELGIAFGVADSTIRNVLHRSGVDLRPPSFHTDAWLRRSSKGSSLA